jgi:C4-dicarboxylate-specific signal transduction histidine kinase
VDDTTMFLEITDSGKGIARSNMNNLFKLGYPRSNEGLGLGLWVSKSIALRRNGNLEYIHNDDNWCFRLTLNRIECQK